MLDYVVRITQDDTKVSKADHLCMRQNGSDDKAIVQITLIASWFNCFNRIADPLSVGR
jgi:alkylhydroperoxidase family enzyme